MHVFKKLKRIKKVYLFCLITQNNAILALFKKCHYQKSVCRNEASFKFDNIFIKKPNFKKEGNLSFVFAFGAI